MHVKTLIETINELKSDLDSMKPISEVQQKLLDKKFRLEFHYNSNHLEGNTLTYKETELLLISDEATGNHSFSEFEEMKASDVAFEFVQELVKEKERPITELFIKNLNQTLLVKPFWKETITPEGTTAKKKIIIGDYKSSPNAVMRSNGERYSYASPQDTPALMGELIEWYKNEVQKEELHPIQIAAIFHHRFLKIHPFDDGNGRIARLIMNYVLLAHDLPPVIIKSEDKSNYLRLLQKADNGNLVPFVDYCANQLLWSLDISLKAAKNESIEEIEDWKKELSILKKNFQKKESLRVIKSNQVLKEAINSRIIPFTWKVFDELSEFDDLFLERRLRLKAQSKGSFFNITATSSFELDIVESTFRNGMEYIVEFVDFTKNGIHPFNIEIQIRLNFGKYKYDLFVEDNLILSKFYHQECTDSEIEETVSKIGKIVVSGIQNQVYQD